MFINASPDSRSLDMVNPKYVFRYFLSVLNERSHSADVIIVKNRIEGGSLVREGIPEPLEPPLGSAQAAICSGVRPSEQFTQ